MPKLRGWKRPEWKSMSGNELRDHLELMSKVGEAYLKLYASGEWPVSQEGWQAWIENTIPDFRVYYPFLPDDTDLLVSEMMANAGPLEENRALKGMRQESVHIHPFPGGCLFEQVVVATLPDGSELRLPGAHIFYLNDEGKVIRSHEYYDGEGLKKIAGG